MAHQMHTSTAVQVDMPDFLTVAEYAAVVRAPESTVRYWRHIGKGPRGRRVGKRVLYTRSEVLAYVDSLADAPQAETDA
jgi:hypothetical protein